MSLTLALETMVDLLGDLIKDVGRLPDIGLPSRLDGLVGAHKVLGALYRDLIRSPIRVRIWDSLGYESNDQINPLGGYSNGYSS